MLAFGSYFVYDHAIDGSVNNLFYFGQPPRDRHDKHEGAGCIGGAILIDAYKRGLQKAGFSNVEVIDSGADLNVYAKIENQSGCCSPATSAETKSQPVVSCSAPEPQQLAVASCCAPAPATDGARLSELLSRYNVNDYAASVKVYALK